MIKTLLAMVFIMIAFANGSLAEQKFDTSPTYLFAKNETARPQRRPASSPTTITPGSWQHFLAPPLAFYLGFGSGQWLEGRYSPAGKTIQMLEISGVGLYILGVVPCLMAYGQEKSQQMVSCSVSISGAILFLGTRFYSVYDTIVGPYQVASANRSSEHSTQQYAFAPYFAPSSQYRNLVRPSELGLQWRWHF